MNEMMRVVEFKDMRFDEARGPTKAHRNDNVIEFDLSDAHILVEYTESAHDGVLNMKTSELVMVGQIIQMRLMNMMHQLITWERMKVSKLTKLVLSLEDQGTIIMM